MTDQILTQSAIEKSFDNLTIVIISFKNLENFFLERAANLSNEEQSLLEAKSVLPRISSSNI